MDHSDGCLSPGGYRYKQCAAQLFRYSFFECQVVVLEDLVHNASATPVMVRPLDSPVSPRTISSNPASLARF